MYRKVSIEIGGTSFMSCRTFIPCFASCVDVDECSDSRLNSCDSSDRAICVNTAGNYTCLCRAGFDGNGRTCTMVCTIYQS